MKKILSVCFSTPILLGFILLSALIAELWRFHGVLWLDLFTPVLVSLCLLKKLALREPFRWTKTALPALLFWGIGLASLLYHSIDLSSNELLKSMFYGIRWISYFGLSLLVLNQKPIEQKYTGMLLLGFATLLSLGGFLQLIFVPNFTSYETLGWDPHQGRLLSTWFDPNFVGGCLAFFVPLLLGYAWDHKKNRGLLFFCLGIIMLALALTLSRSAYLSLLVGGLIFSLLRSLKLLAVGILLFSTISFTLSPVRDRVESLWQSFSALNQQSYNLPDASARLRYQSWENAWTLFEKEPLWGQGYNRYKRAGLQEHILSNSTSHASTGSDSSLLTILATTGIMGFLSFFSLYLLLAKTAWDQRRSGFSSGFFAALCGLFFHSIFVNSLLFPLFMAPFWISAGLLQTNFGASQKLDSDQ